MSRFITGSKPRLREQDVEAIRTDQEHDDAERGGALVPGLLLVDRVRRQRVDQTDEVFVLMRLGEEADHDRDDEAGRRTRRSPTRSSGPSRCDRSWRLAIQPPLMPHALPEGSVRAWWMVAAAIPETRPKNAPSAVARFQNMPSRNVARSGRVDEREDELEQVHDVVEPGRDVGRARSRSPCRRGSRSAPSTGNACRWPGA